MIEYIAATMSFLSLNGLLMIGLLGPSYLMMIKNEWNHRKVSFTEQKGRLEHYVS